MEVAMHDMHKQFTEPIFDTLAEYRAALVEHPLLRAAKKGELSEPLLREFALHQYFDSIVWIPMLAQMGSKAVRSERLRRAIHDNIGHEAGLGLAPSHVTLAVELVRSLGVKDLDEETRRALVARETGETAGFWLSDTFATSGEPEIAGYLVTAETLVPILFASFLPCFEKLGGDVRYLAEHIEVDAVEHASWMREAVAEVALLYGPTSIKRIRAGMNEAWIETNAVPDDLWRRRRMLH
jgi:hypothetical protein